MISHEHIKQIFRVDMAFNYHGKPSKFSNAIWKDLGSSVDEYIFPTDLSSMDIFGFGKTSDGEVAKAGLGTGYNDNLSNHMMMYQQSKKNFGVVKKLSTEPSFFLRSPDLIDMLAMGGRQQSIIFNIIIADFGNAPHILGSILQAPQALGSHS